MTLSQGRSNRNKLKVSMRINLHCGASLDCQSFVICSRNLAALQKWIGDLTEKLTREKEEREGLAKEMFSREEVSEHMRSTALFFSFPLHLLLFDFLKAHALEVQSFSAQITIMQDQLAHTRNGNKSKTHRYLYLASIPHLCISPTIV